MALVYADSFNHRDTARYQAIGNTHGGGVFNSAGRNGYALRLGTESFTPHWFAQVDLDKYGGTNSTTIVGMAVYIDVVPSSAGQIFEMFHTGSIMIRVSASTGGWTVYSDGGGTLASNTGTPPTQAAWFWLEVKTLFHASSGTVEVRVNGATEVSLTGVNTSPSSKTSATQIRVGEGPGNATTGSMAEDLVVMDGSGSEMNDFIGDSIVQFFTPNSDESIALDGSDGNQTDNYDLVREVPISSTSYVGGSTAGDKDYYGLLGLSTSSVWTVHGGQIHAKVGKEAGGNAFGRLIARDTSSTSLGAAIGLSTSYGYDYLTLPTAPSGSTWTTSLINDLEIGFEVRAST